MNTTTLETQTFKFLDMVETPNGVGLVQGQLVEHGQAKRYLVSHDARGELAPELRDQYHGGPWVLNAYAPDQLKRIGPAKFSIGRRH